MKCLIRKWGGILLSLAYALSIQADPEITAKDLPRMPLVAPKDATNTIHIKKGFHVELVASEPLIASPVAMAFDERGRLFVAEMVDYSEKRDVMPHLGRIRMLEDTNGDGIFDKSTVYADNLPMPTAVFCYDGGIFVGATPDILYLKDTKHDGKADFREVVFTGFASTSPRLNVQEMLNSFIWGLDNRIHGSTSGEGGIVKALKHPEARLLDLKGRDFVIDPRTMSMTSEAGGGQHGLSFDDYGHRFTCNNSDHLRMFQYDDRYAARNPFYTMPKDLASIAVDGPAAEVFRISPDEPWRVIRTHWRVASLVTGPVEGGGRASGYFTGATGVTIYRGDAFPKEYLDNAFVGECAGNLVSRKILSPSDVSLKGERAPDEKDLEFLASTDTWFRPVQFANAPDGALYLIDMHREIVEHPWALPDNLKKFLDLTSGSDCGRIFRIVPDGFQQPKLPRLDKANGLQVAAALESSNGWTRDTASRLLYQRQDMSAVPTLVNLVHHSQYPLARIHALHALEGLGSLSESLVLDALADQDAWVRVHAIRLSEIFVMAKAPTARLFNQLSKMAEDPSNQVRYQLAFTLGEFFNGDKITPLTVIAKRDVDSPLIQAAVLSSLANGAEKIFANLSADKDFTAKKSGQEFLQQLAGIIGAKNTVDEVASTVDFIGSLKNPSLSFALIHGLADGLQKAGSSLEKVDNNGKLQSVFDQAIKQAVDASVAETNRVEGIQLLGFSKFSQSNPTLISLLKANSPPVQLATIAALGHFSDPQVAAALTNHWQDFSPRVRSEALSVLMARPERALTLLQAMSAGEIKAGELTTAQVKFLKQYHDKDVRQAAVKLFGSGPSKSRQEVVAAYQPALNLKGDAEAGRKIYLSRCVGCHRLGGSGFAVGPDLVTVKSNGKDKILVSILDPSREVAPQYIAFDIDKKDGESSVGIIANESPASITLRQAYGKEDVIARANIKSMKSQSQSLMPEGLEQGLAQQDLADLLEYISTANAQ